MGVDGIGSGVRGEGPQELLDLKVGERRGKVGRKR